MPAKHPEPKPAGQPAPPLKISRHRSEDEMTRALKRVEMVAGDLNVHRDDEHDQVLRDAVYELLEMRRILMTFVQAVGAAHEATLAAIKALTT
ncbi:MAG: hypothetical protein ABI324_18670 [Ktedonobacteraceae bacterium]